jgi:hypothetical protein
VVVVVNVGAVMGAGHFGRCDGRDHSIMTARRRCRSVFREDRGIARVGGCFAGAHARVGESFADTAGPASKVRGRACPFKNRVSGTGSGLCSPLSSSSHARIPLCVLPCIRSAAASHASSPPETPPPRCRTGHAPTCPASSSSVSSRRASFLHSPLPWSGRSPATSLCRAPKGFVAFHERGFSVPPDGSSVASSSSTGSNCSTSTQITSSRWRYLRRCARGT